MVDVRNDGDIAEFHTKISDGWRAPMSGGVLLCRAHNLFFAFAKEKKPQPPGLVTGGVVFVF
ncbi:MAG: hypothetical protein KUL88_09700 [Rhizobium sp.]|nr:hypothetical protein [Rhizobium sp.]